MRFYLEIKNDNSCYDVANAIKDQLENNGFTYDQTNPELVFSIGGDGTFLQAIHHYRRKNPLFIGINEGNLGFLCQFNDDEIADLLDDVIARNFRIVKECKLLQAEVNGELYYCFNDMRFEANNGLSLSFNIDVNRNLLEQFHGDGICFSTATGSTGINKSLGGAMIDNDLEVIQLTEKTPMNSRAYRSLNNSLVMNGETIFELYNFNRENFLFVYDTFAKNITLKDDMIRVQLSNKKVSILLNKDHSLINKINKNFIG